MYDELVELWQATTQTPVGSVDADLDTLRSFYDPVLVGRKLRERLLQVEPPRSVESVIPSQARVRIGHDRMIITLEGRVLLELLCSALSNSHGDAVCLDEELAINLLCTVLEKYRSWGRRRISDVVQLMSGGKALQVPAIGGALTLLVNRSDRRDRAIKRVAEGSARDEIDAAFRAPAEAFSQVIAPSERRSAEKERLISGWTLHEINRRLPGALAIEEEEVYVAENRRQELLAFIASELARPRRHVTAESLVAAFDGLVAAYRSNIDTLAGFGMAFERPSETAQLKEQLLEAFNRASP